MPEGLKAKINKMVMELHNIHVWVSDMGTEEKEKNLGRNETRMSGWMMGSLLRDRLRYEDVIWRASVARTSGNFRIARMT